MMKRRGEGGVGEPTQLCKNLITAQVSTTWTRSSGMKRCCDMQLPFKRKRQQSFATSSFLGREGGGVCCETGRFRTNYGALAKDATGCLVKCELL
jgi:hypothetical protein